MVEENMIPEGWKQKELGELLTYEQPWAYEVSNTDYVKAGRVPVLTAGKTFILGYTTDKYGIYDGEPIILFDDFTTATRYVDFPFKVKSSACKLLHAKNCDLRYVFYAMNTIVFNQTEHKRYWISEYSKIPIPLPPLPEQRRIAAVLSNLDDYIEKQERLIEKNKKFRDGMLEELISKIRSEKYVPLGQVVQIKTGKKDAGEKVEDGPYLFFTCSKTPDRIDTYAFDGRAILIAGNGNFHIQQYEGRFDAYQRTYVLMQCQRFDMDFVYYYLLSRFQRKCVEESNESVIAFITLPMLESFQLPFVTLSEQQRIASIMSDLDDNIAKQQEKLDKARKLKDALLNDLISGKIRLTDDKK